MPRGAKKNCRGRLSRSYEGVKFVVRKIFYYQNVKKKTKIKFLFCQLILYQFKIIRENLAQKYNFFYDCQ